MKDDLCPPGSVTVKCAHKGCGTSWWVSPKEAKEKEGPWDCGADHDYQTRVHRMENLLAIKYGLVWGQGFAEPLPPGQANDMGCGMSFLMGFPKDRKIALLIHDRGWRNTGYLVYGAEDVGRVDKLATQVMWEKDSHLWPDWVRAHHKDSSTKERFAPKPEGMLYVYYNLCDKNGKDTGKRRSYTFKPCSDCGRMIRFDTKDHTFSPENYSVGSDRRPGDDDLKPVPYWYDQPMTCRQEMYPSTWHVPCHLDEKMKAIEAKTGIRCTLWYGFWEKEKGACLFYNPETNKYGGLVYSGTLMFDNEDMVTSAITWGSRADIHAYFATQGSHLEWARQIEGNLYESPLNLPS